MPLSSALVTSGPRLRIHFALTAPITTDPLLPGPTLITHVPIIKTLTTIVKDYLLVIDLLMILITAI
jgi:hypothetical protein